MKNRQKQLKIKEKIRKNFDYDNDYKKELLISKERNIFRDIFNDRLEQLQLATHDIDYRNLKYEVITSSDDYQFDGLKDPLTPLNDIKLGKVSTQEAKNTQKEYNKQSNLI